MVAILLLVFVILLGVGVPVGFAMGLGAVASFALEMPRGMINIPTKMFAGLDSFSLMAIPFFILAGDLMGASGISRSLINFADLLVGWVRGGMALVAVVSCVVFASICGSASASTSAIGSIMISSMTDRGYSKGFASCLVASGGTIGPIIPPSILAVLYGGATGLSVGALFMAGVVPGFLLAAAFSVVSIVYAKRHPEVAFAGRHIGFAEAGRICVEALPALFMPVIIIGGILSGIVTATEASGVACLYGMGVGFASGKLTLRNCWNIFASSALSVSKIMLIIAVATLFGWILSIRRFPAEAGQFLTNFSPHPQIVMLLIIGFLVIVGCFMDAVGAMIILVPILYPIGKQIGFDPVHYAMLIIVTLLFGAITPPVGILLYITSNIAGIRFQESLRYIAPFVICFAVVILILLFWPSLTIALPRSLGLM